MKIKTFINTERANEFLEKVKPISVEYQKKFPFDKIVVIYNEIPEVKKAVKLKIEQEEAECLWGLKEAEMQLQYLEHLASLSEETAKITESSIEGTKNNIRNYKAKLDTIKVWQSESHKTN